MNRIKITSLLLCLCLAISSLALVSCDNHNGGESIATTGEHTTETEKTESETSAATTEKTEYTVSVKSAGCLELQEVEFEVYADKECTSLRARGETDLSGKATFKLALGEYYIKITSAPDGYIFNELYTVTSSDTLITLESYIRDEAPAANFTYQKGDVIHNFVLSGKGDTAITVKDALEEYGCIVLNFWYIGCGPCKAEFPYIQSAYEKYSEKVGFFALNGNPAESDADIESFMTSNNYTFKTGRADNALMNNFDVAGFPTTVIIDKYGVICVIDMGSVPQEAPFVNAFEYFTSDIYTETKFFDSLHDIPAK